MATLPNMGIELPVIGGDAGVWDDKLNAALMLTDSHDHTPGKGVRIRTAALEIDGDLSFGGHGATALGKVALSTIAPLTTGARTFFVSSADNELYFRSSAGTNIKVTSGGTLNLSLVGGILGDYAAAGAEVAYDAANERYTFKQHGVTKPWARLASGPVRIHEHGTTESVFVELAVAAALAAPYTLTLPAALPATHAIAQVAPDGTVTFSRSVPKINATEDYAHSAEFRVTVPAFMHPSSDGVVMVQHDPMKVKSTALTWWYYTPTLGSIGLRQGDRVKRVRVRYSNNGGASVNVTVSHYRADSGLADTIASSTAAQGTITVEPPDGKNKLEEHDTMLDQMWISVSGQGLDVEIHAIEVYWDHPES